MRRTRSGSIRVHSWLQIPSDLGLKSLATQHLPRDWFSVHYALPKCSPPAFFAGFPAVRNACRRDPLIIRLRQALPRVHKNFAVFFPKKYVMAIFA